MSSDSLRIGKTGESYAKTYLQSKGYKIIGQNVTSHWGEIDFVVQDKEKIRFIEVKTRTSSIKGKPYEAVQGRKIRSLHRSIQDYCMKHNVLNRKLSLDVISIILDMNLKMKEIIYFENIEV